MLFWFVKLKLRPADWVSLFQLDLYFGRKQVDYAVLQRDHAKELKRFYKRLGARFKRNVDFKLDAVGFDARLIGHRILGVDGEYYEASGLVKIVATIHFVLLDFLFKPAVSTFGATCLTKKAVKVACLSLAARPVFHPLIKNTMFALFCSY
jgi:hypothetical protein